MSATGRNLEGKERHEGDFYETEGWVTRSILEVVPICGSVLDAGCGTGSILREVIKVRGLHLSVAQGIELDQERCNVANADHVTRGFVFQGDFLSVPPAPQGMCTCCTVPKPWSAHGHRAAYDVVIGNPPYNRAEEFVDQGRKMGSLLIFLLRLNFLGSQKRAAKFSLYMPDVYVLPKRPSFTGDGRTDATEYAWFVWGSQREKNETGRVQVLRVPDDAGKR